MSNTPARHLLAATSFLVLAALGRTQDDRENTTSTAHALYSGLSAQAVDDLLVSQGYRLTDIEYDPTQANPFTVTAVRNTGSYARTWWWYYGLTLAQVGTYLNTNQARLTDLERYQVGGQPRFACLMESNTGQNAKTWWYQTGVTMAALVDFVNTHNARIVDLDTEVVNGGRYYTAVMIHNTGADQRGWWFYHDLTTAQISSLLSSNNAYLRDLEPQDNGLYTVVMQSRQGLVYWWYYGQTLGDLWFKARQNGARLIDVERYEVNGATRFAGIMLNNSNALTTRVGELMRDATDGAVGLYLKQVNGSERAGLLDDWSFEPASTMKTLHHVHAMRRVSLNQLDLNAVWAVPTSTNGSCPTGGAPFVNQSVSTVLQQMMENSSNTHTLRVTQQFGMAALNQTAAALGMTGTSLNHTLGCGGPIPNQLTLVDLGRLHEQVANGYLGAERDTFYALMSNSLGSYPSWGTLQIADLVDQEAAVLGIPPAMVATFKANCDLAYKPGSYTIDGKQYRAIGGFLRMPFVVAGQLAPREYVTGAFVHEATNAAEAEAAAAIGAIEVLRDEVRAALQTWDGLTFGSFTSFGSSCAGSNGLPSHTATGNPTIGQPASFRLTSGPSARLVSLSFGASKTAWNAIPLPFSLAVLNAPGCFLRVEPLVPLAMLTNAAGSATLPLALPNQPALVGQSFHTQFLCLDPAANAGGLTSTNGITTLLGGVN